jgi:hypothetical protein
MNPYTLTLLRHGEIDHDGRLIGRTDLPLNDLGCEQMSRSWQRLNQLAPVTSMATSPCNAAASLPCIRPAWFAAAEGGRAFCRIRFWRLGRHVARRAVRPASGLGQPRGRWRTDAAGRRESYAVPHPRADRLWRMDSDGTRQPPGTGVPWRRDYRLLAELLGTEFAVAKLMTVQRGGFAQLSILEGHPAYLMHLESPGEA